jgi:hypothetical protein
MKPLTPPKAKRPADFRSNPMDFSTDDLTEWSRGGSASDERLEAYRDYLRRTHEAIQRQIEADIASCPAGKSWRF